MCIILTTIFDEGVGLLWFFGEKYRGLFLSGIGLFVSSAMLLFQKQHDIRHCQTRNETRQSLY
ncbi:hypothetical protein [Algoriphagus persicinus]|uniref:hypothetical protein n=1 Tax=Algoriphagus persicinus TaxID=3108754 RepID=UPI002B37CE4C|nr:hypothetical protein [Algoriphagus sp. E1-3-M2]MEB2786929.1 hypothetical protein [Algoriphagus sp. E1-3-M2]